MRYTVTIVWRFLTLLILLNVNALTLMSVLRESHKERILSCFSWIVFHIKIALNCYANDFLKFIYKFLQYNIFTSKFFSMLLLIQANLEIKYILVMNESSRTVIAKRMCRCNNVWSQQINNCLIISKSWRKLIFELLITGKSGQPSFGRLFQYPKFESTSALANKSFFQVRLFYYYNAMIDWHTL